MSHLEKWCQFAEKIKKKCLFGFFGGVLAEIIAPKRVLDMEKVENPGSRQCPAEKKEMELGTDWKCSNPSLRDVNMSQCSVVFGSSPCP